MRQPGNRMPNEKGIHLRIFWETSSLNAFMENCMPVRKFVVLMIVFLMVLFARAQEYETPDQYLHPDSRISSELPSSIFADSEKKPITPREAAGYALGLLRRHRVANPVICEARWIAAPVSGYLVDALGTLANGEVLYSVFRVGLRDGLERADGLRKAGEEFVFIAMGRDTSGNIVWYPPPGPDHQPAADEAFDVLLPFEFLLNREDFETLPKRYPIRQDQEP